jgi:hypothetical protein
LRVPGNVCLILGFGFCVSIGRVITVIVFVTFYSVPFFPSVPGKRQIRRKAKSSRDEKLDPHLAAIKYRFWFVYCLHCPEPPASPPFHATNGTTCNHNDIEAIKHIPAPKTMSDTLHIAIAHIVQGFGGEQKQGAALGPGGNKVPVGQYGGFNGFAGWRFSVSSSSPLIFNMSFRC